MLQKSDELKERLGFWRSAFARNPQNKQLVSDLGFVKAAEVLPALESDEPEAEKLVVSDIDRLLNELKLR